MGLRQRLIKGTAFNLIAVMFNQGSTLIVNIIVARILLKTVFGEYAIVQGTLLTIATLSQLATGYTASRYVAEYRSSNPLKAGRIMGLCAVVSASMAGISGVIIYFLAPWLAGVMLRSSHLTIPLMIGIVFLFFSSINGYQIGALSGLEAYRCLAIAGIVSGVAMVVLVPIGAWLWGLNGTIACLGISMCLRCLVHNIWLRRESQIQGINVQYRVGLIEEKSILMKFAIPSALASFFSLPMIWLANSFLVRQPSGYDEMALYSAANNIRILVLFIPNVMNNVGLSVINNETENT